MLPTTFVAMDLTALFLALPRLSADLGREQRAAAVDQRHVAANRAARQPEREPTRT
ncbi:hypothetical protein [Actinocatenispora sera]|nr:hypothetical protein [Actinocatenispora sera]